MASSVFGFDEVIQCIAVEKMRQDTSTLSATRAMTGKFGCGPDTPGMSQVKPKIASHLIGAHECRRLHSRLVDYIPASLGSFAGRGEMTLSAFSVSGRSRIARRIQRKSPL